MRNKWVKFQSTEVGLFPLRLTTCALAVLKFSLLLAPCSLLLQGSVQFLGHGFFAGSAALGPSKEGLTA